MINWPHARSTGMSRFYPPGVHGHSGPSAPLCVRQHCSHHRPNLTKPSHSPVHFIGTGIAVMARTLDEVMIGSADNLSDRCSGHVQAHI